MLPQLTSYADQYDQPVTQTYRHTYRQTYSRTSLSHRHTIIQTDRQTRQTDIWSVFCKKLSILTFVDNGVDLATKAWLAAKGLIGWKTALANTFDISAVGWTTADDDGLGNIFVNELGCNCSPRSTIHANTTQSHRYAK